MIDQWTPIDVREFRTSWGVSPATATKNMSSVKAFFEFALSNEWIGRNPARLVRSPRSRANADPRNEERIPAAARAAAGMAREDGVKAACDGLEAILW
jgi:site-specific recombinase XerC